MSNQRKYQEITVVEAWGIKELSVSINYRKIWMGLSYISNWLIMYPPPSEYTISYSPTLIRYSLLKKLCDKVQVE